MHDTAKVVSLPTRSTIPQTAKVSVAAATALFPKTARRLKLMANEQFVVQLDADLARKTRKQGYALTIGRLTKLVKAYGPLFDFVKANPILNAQNIYQSKPLSYPYSIEINIPDSWLDDKQIIERICSLSPSPSKYGIPVNIKKQILDPETDEYGVRLTHPGWMTFIEGAENWNATIAQIFASKKATVANLNYWADPLSYARECPKDEAFILASYEGVVGIDYFVVPTTVVPAFSLLARGPIQSLKDLNPDLDLARLSASYGIPNSGVEIDFPANWLMSSFRHFYFTS